MDRKALKAWLNRDEARPNVPHERGRRVYPSTLPAVVLQIIERAEGRLNDAIPALQRHFETIADPTERTEQIHAVLRACGADIVPPEETLREFLASE